MAKAVNWVSLKRAVYALSRCRDSIVTASTLTYNKSLHYITSLTHWDIIDREEGTLT